MVKKIVKDKKHSMVKAISNIKLKYNGRIYNIGDTMLVIESDIKSLNSYIEIIENKDGVAKDIKSTTFKDMIITK